MSAFLDILQFGWVDWEGFDQRKSYVQSINRGLTLETTTLLDQKRLSSVKIKWSESKNKRGEKDKYNYIPLMLICVEKTSIYKL